MGGTIYWTGSITARPSQPASSCFPFETAPGAVPVRGLPRSLTGRLLDERIAAQAILDATEVYHPGYFDPTLLKRRGACIWITVATRL